MKAIAASAVGKFVNPVAWCLLVLVAIFAPAKAAMRSNEAEVRAAVERAVPLLERSSAFTLQERACFTCHHGAHPAMALNAAWTRGFTIDRSNLDDQLERAYRELVNDVPRFRQGFSVSKTADGPGHALWMLDVSGWEPDAVVQAALEFFLNENRDLDHWEPPMNRPPTIGSAFTTTFLVLRALKLHGAPAQQPLIMERARTAKDWLTRTPSEETEDNVYRLRALHAIAAKPQELQLAAERLLRAQRPDGGWAQLRTLESDAYATGTALAALLDTGMLKPTDPATQAAMKFLLRTQLDDGSWYVRKRTHAVQPFFNSDFPHKDDQFIAVSATSWAAYALITTLPPHASRKATPYLADRPIAQSRLRSANADGERVVKFSAPQFAFFAEKIQPQLAEHCYSCHSSEAKKLKAELLLDSRGGMLTGGISGPALKPGDAEHSLLMHALEGKKCELMPPKKKLPSAIIADFRQWIEMGAPDPRVHGQVPK